VQISLNVMITCKTDMVVKAAAVWKGNCSMQLSGGADVWRRAIVLDSFKNAAL